MRFLHWVGLPAFSLPRSQKSAKCTVDFKASKVCVCTRPSSNPRPASVRLTTSGRAPSSGSLRHQEMLRGQDAGGPCKALLLHVLRYRCDFRLLCVTLVILSRVGHACYIFENANHGPKLRSSVPEACTIGNSRFAREMFRMLTLQTAHVLLARLPCLCNVLRLTQLVLEIRMSAPGRDLADPLLQHCTVPVGMSWQFVANTSTAEPWAPSMNSCLEESLSQARTC